jgi:hypothetical protein
MHKRDNFGSGYEAGYAQAVMNALACIKNNRTLREAAEAIKKLDPPSKNK